MLLEASQSNQPRGDNVEQQVFVRRTPSKVLFAISSKVIFALRQGSWIAASSLGSIRQLLLRKAREVGGGWLSVERRDSFISS